MIDIEKKYIIVNYTGKNDDVRDGGVYTGVDLADKQWTTEYLKWSDRDMLWDLSVGNDKSNSAHLKWDSSEQKYEEL